MSNKWDGMENELGKKKTDFIAAYPKFGQIEITPGKFYLSSEGIEVFDPAYHEWGAQGLKIDIYPVLSQGDEVRPMFQGTAGKSSYGYVKKTLPSAEKLTG